jgi:hypothetical protein
MDEVVVSERVMVTMSPTFLATRGVKIEALSADEPAARESAKTGAVSSSIAITQKSALDFMFILPFTTV